MKCIFKFILTSTKNRVFKWSEWYFSIQQFQLLPSDFHLISADVIKHLLKNIIFKSGSKHCVTFSNLFWDQQIFVFSYEVTDIFWLSRSHKNKPNLKPFKQLSKCSKHLNAALINSIFIRFSFHFCRCHQSSRNITFKTGFVKNSR